MGRHSALHTARDSARVSRGGGVSGDFATTSKVKGRAAARVVPTGRLERRLTAGGGSNAEGCVTTALKRGFLCALLGLSVGLRLGCKPAEKGVIKITHFHLKA